MFKLRAMLCCVLLTFLALPVMADEMVSLKLGYQSLSPSGTLAGNQGGVGTLIDVEKDLNYKENQDLTAEVVFQMGSSRLSLGYLPVEYSGTGMLTVSGNYKGIPISVGETVQTRTKFNLYDLGYTLNLINMDDLPVRVQLGAELAVKIIDGEVDFVDVAAGINESDSGTVPIPTVGARVRLGFSDFIGVIARIGYMEYDGNRVMDAEAQLEFSPLPMFGVYAGYRTFNLTVDEPELAIDVDLSGPFVGALIRF